MQNFVKLRHLILSMKCFITALLDTQSQFSLVATPGPFAHSGVSQVYETDARVFPVCTRIMRGLPSGVFKV